MDDAVSKHKEDANRNELLIWASARGLTADAKELIRLGAEPMAKDKKGYMPVHYAASHGHKELAEFLGSRGADLDMEDPQGRTPLHYAAAGGFLPMVAFLVSKVVWLDGYDAQDDAALHLAARGGHQAVAQLLHEKGAKVNLVNKRGLTPLGEALVGGHMAVAEDLRAAGADINVTARGFTLLHLVCGLGVSSSAAWLLGAKAKADPNEAFNLEALTPLHAAAMAGSLECVELLLKHGADAAARNAAGQLPSELVPQAAPTASETAKDTAKQNKLLAELRSKLDAAAAKANKGGKAAAAKEPASAPSKVPTSAPKPELPEQATFTERFAALAKDEQLARVDRYVGMDDAALPTDVQPAAKTQIQELRKATHMLTCIKAVSALRSDEDFQQDINNPEVKAAMEVIKKTNDMTKYLKDSRVQGVMAKMQRLQAVLKQHGNPQVGMEDIMVTQTGPRSLEETARKIQSMEAMVKDVREQAIALLLGRVQDQPKAESQASLLQAPAQKDMPPAKSKDSAGKLHQDASKATGAAPSLTKKSAEIEELPNDSPAPLDPLDGRYGGRPRPTTWKGVLKEFGIEAARQLFQSTVITIATLLVLWYFGMLPDWLFVKRPVEETLDVAQAAQAVREGMDAADNAGYVDFE